MSLSNHVHYIEKPIVATLTCNRCKATIAQYGFLKDVTLSDLLRLAETEEWVEKDGEVLCDECACLDGVDLSKITFSMFD